jgi:hypothetical protein
MTVKVIMHTGECEHPDDPTLPIKLDMVLKPPSFMEFTWFAMYGASEDIVVRSNNIEEMHLWMEELGLKNHIRLRRYEITDGDVVIESVDRTK